MLFKGRPFDPNSPDYVQAYWPPLTLISLAAPLREAGFNVLLLEHRYSLEENWARMFAVLDRVIYVGISALTGFEITDGLRFCDRVREAQPDLPIVWGGWHACSLPEQTLSDSRVDIVISGLGQKLSVCVAQRLQRGIMYFKDLPNIQAKPKWNTSPPPSDEPPLLPMKLDDVPLPAYDFLDLEWLKAESKGIARKSVARGLKITGYINYVSSFGCPFRCTYCANPDIFGSQWGGYDVERVAKQISMLSEKGFNWIEFIDAEFLVRWKRVKLLCETIIEMGVTIRWSSQATVSSILQLDRHGLMPLLIESGCYSFNVGAESGSENVLSYIEKKQSAEDILDCAQILTNYGLEGSFNCLVGLPKQETEQDIYHTFSLAYRLKKINPNFSFPISFYTPLPGSKMFNDAVDAGFEAPDTLEGWGQYETSYRVQANSLPWRNRKLEKLVYLVVTFYLPMSVPSDMRRGTVRNLRRHLKEHPLRHLIWIGHKMAVFRMRRQYFNYPVEYHLFRFWSWLAGVKGYAPGSVVQDE